MMKRFIVPLQVVVTVSDQLLLMRATKEYFGLEAPLGGRHHGET